MWINYESMLVCPLDLTLVAQIFQKVACFWSSPNLYPNLPIFFTRIYPSYPWHFPSLTITIYILKDDFIFETSQFEWIHYIILTERIPICAEEKWVLFQIWFLTTLNTQWASSDYYYILTTIILLTREEKKLLDNYVI